MNKKQIAIVASAICMAAGVARGEAPSLRVVASDGKTTTLELRDQMSSGYFLDDSGEKMLLRILDSMKPGSETRDVLFEIPVTDLSGIVFEGVRSAVEEVSVDNLRVDIADGRLIFTGVIEPITVSVYSIEGVNELTRTIKSDTELDLHEVGEGIHIVTAGVRTFKINVR
jgi:hypothetical protein